MFFITPEIIENAKTYIPLAEKVANAQEIAELVFAPDEPDESEEQTPAQTALELIGFRAVARENVIVKAVRLLGILVHDYLGIEFTDEKPFDYDEYASSHILNQLERYKSFAEYRIKVFDLLADYKEYKKIIEAEIYNERTVRNDFLLRFNDELAANGDPKKLVELAKLPKEASKEYLAALKKNGILANDKNEENKKEG